MSKPIEIAIEGGDRTGPRVPPWWIKNFCTQFGELASHSKTGDLTTVVFKDQRHADMAVAVLKESATLESGTIIRGWYKGQKQKNSRGNSRGRGRSRRRSESRGRGRRDRSRSRRRRRSKTRSRSRSRRRDGSRERKKDSRDSKPTPFTTEQKAVSLPEVDHFKKRYNLNPDAAAALQDALVKQETPKQQSYFMELEQVFDKAENEKKDPNEQLPVLVWKIGKGEPLLCPWDDESEEESSAEEAPEPGSPGSPMPLSEIEHLKLKYKLSIGATLSLEEALNKQEAKKKNSYFIELEEAFDVTVSKGRNPDEAVPDLITKINNGEPLLQPWLSDSDSEGGGEKPPEGEEPPPPPPEP